MSNVRHPATVVLSMDAGAGVAGRSGLDEIAAHVLARLHAAGLAATWALPDLGCGLVRDQLATAAAQEVALLGDGSWIGPGVPRTVLAAALARRLEAASACGLQTLVVSGGGLPSELDVLARHGIRAVRTSAALETGGRSGGLLNRALGWLAGRGAPLNAQPRSLRWGLWELSVTAAFPLYSFGAVRRRLDRAVADGAQLHVAIDLARLDAGRRADLAAVGRLLDYLGRGQDEGVLRVRSIAGVIAELVQAQQGRPARSILRRAA